MKWWMVLIIVLVITAAIMAVLYFLGKRAEKKQAEQQAQIDAAKQVVSMLIIDKKKIKLKEAGFPDQVLEQTPFYLRFRKFPVVKGKVGPRIMSFITENDVYDQIPVKKEVKATISGLYITEVRGLRGPLPKAEKKESKLDQLLKKGRGEA